MSSPPPIATPSATTPAPAASSSIDYEELFKKFDRGLVITLDKFIKTVNNKIEIVQRKLENVENKFYSYLSQNQKKTQYDLSIADRLVTKELRSKIIMSEWTNKFLSITNDSTLDPVTFAFARFALNICMCYQDVPASYFISSNIHVLLVSLMKFESELVVGPAVLGLVHLSLHQEMKSEIVITANALPILLKLLATSSSDLILTQCCKLLASLALHPPNKSPIVSSGCYHGIMDMVGGIRTGNIDVRINSCKAAVNIVMGSDSNRVLSVELDAIRPLLSVIQFVENSFALENAISALANISYCNSFTGSKILSLGGDLAFVEVLNTGNIFKQSELINSTLIAIANLCSSESNQSHVGSCKGMIETLVRICDYAREPHVVTEAANVMLAMAWRNTGNKSRVVSGGGCSVLLKRIIRHAPLEDEPNVQCLEKCCMALASLLIFRSNHEKFYEIGGIQEINRLCKRAVSRRVLAVACTILVTLIPSPDEIKRLHEDFSTIPVETHNVLASLKRTQLFAFGHLPNPPDWLALGISILSMNDNELGLAPKWEKTEYVDKIEFFKELSAHIFPEVDFNTFPAAKGLIFSIQ